MHSAGIITAAGQGYTTTGSSGWIRIGERSLQENRVGVIGTATIYCTPGGIRVFAIRQFLLRKDSTIWLV